MSKPLAIPTLVLFLVFSSHLSYASDTNGLRGSVCGAPAPDNSSNTWTTNLNNVFNSLSANVNSNGGFYRTESGQNPDKMYGLIQCRSDISASDCSACTQESFRLASTECDRNTITVSIWQKWCFLRYSNSSFYGVWERTGAALSNGTSDDPTVAANGMAMMEGLVGSASNGTMMFARGEIDDGRGGKRYGMAQCTRDLRMSDCRDCLNFLLSANNETIGNRRGWEAYAVGCAMWYDDYQFYFTANSTAPSNGSMVPPQPSIPAPFGPLPPLNPVLRIPPPSNSADRFSGVRFGMGIAILMTAMAYL